MALHVQPFSRFTSFPLTMFRVPYLKQQLRPFDKSLQRYLSKKYSQGIDDPLEDIHPFPFSKLPLGAFYAQHLSDGTSFPGEEGEREKALATQKLVLTYTRMFSFDCVTVNNQVLPMLGNFFVVPNGCSLSPPSSTLEFLKSSWQGEKKFIEVPKGTKIPRDMILVHERGNHYSLQVARPMPLQEANNIMENFFSSMKLVPFDIAFIAKRQRWGFGQDVMNKIYSYVAFDWPQTPPPSPVNKLLAATVGFFKSMLTLPFSHH